MGQLFQPHSGRWLFLTWPKSLHPSTCPEPRLACRWLAVCDRQMNKCLAMPHGGPAPCATSSKENSWDNRESIHVCQADLKLFPVAQEWRNTVEKYVRGGRSSCGQRQALLALALSVRVCRFPLERWCGKGRQVVVGTRQHSYASRSPALVPFSSLLNILLKPHMFGPPQLVFILVQSEGCSDFGELHGKVLNVF